jgi:hypothetical protein
VGPPLACLLGALRRGAILVLLAAGCVLSDLNATPADAAGAVVFSSTRSEPDGFVINPHNSTLWLVADDGGGLRHLVEPGGAPIQGWDPSWSPGGNAIAYVENSPTENHWQLSLVSADGRRRRTLAVEGTGSPFSAINDPDWSPDGKWIAFSAHTADRAGWDAARLWQTDIYLASVDGSQVRRLSGRGPGGEKLWDEEPSFSPDGRRILFTRTTELTALGIRPPGSGLYSVGLQGGEPQPVFVGEFPADDTSPAPLGGPTFRSASFSPDGREIAFLVSDTLYTVSSDGSGLRALGKVGRHTLNTAVTPAWDPAPVFILSERYEPLLKLYPDGHTAPLTTVPEQPELRAEFTGDDDPDWRPATPVAPLTDIVPPATFLFDRARPRPIAAAATTRRRSLTLRRGNLSFFAVDSAGIAAVHVAIARTAKPRRGRAMCRFLGAKRFSGRPRQCAHPSYRRVRSAASWQRLQRLRPGRYLLWLRTTDGHGTKTPTRAVRLRLRR